MSKIYVSLIGFFLANSFVLYTATPLLAQTTTEANIPPFNPNRIISDSELTDYNSLSEESIQRFLTAKGSALASYEARDIDGATRSAAKIIWRAAQNYGISPKVLLVILQKEQSLIENDNPEQRDYDWASGYAVCDSCATNDPMLQKFKGFAIQVDQAAWRNRYYLTHPKEFKIQVGEPILIDNTVVTPFNQATANLYIYTPHLHGNQNFWTLWHTYFSTLYPDGSLLQEENTDNVWLLTDGRLRLVNSKAALFSDYDPKKIITVTTNTILGYDIGVPINFPNYSLLRAPNDTIYLLVDSQRRGIASEEVFRQLGFNPEEVIDADWADINVYPETAPIASANSSPLGELIQDKKTGGVYYVVDATRYPIWSKEILRNKFPRYIIKPVSPETLNKLPIGEPVRFKDGELVMAQNEKTVYVISRGEKRPIASAETFTNLGYHWSNIITTTSNALNIHPTGNLIQG